MAKMKNRVENGYTIYLKNKGGKNMPDYPKMYAILCGAASEAIDRIKEGSADAAAQLLQSALLEAEEIYIVDGDKP